MNDESARKLPEYLFDLLDPAEKADLERRLAESGSLRDTLEALRTMAADWDQEDSHPAEPELRQWIASGVPATRAAAGDRDAMLDHVLQCRECAFLTSILLAERSADTRSPAFGLGPREGRLSGALSKVAALVAVAIVGFGAGMFLRAGEPEAPPSTVSAKRASPAGTDLGDAGVGMSLPLFLQVNRAGSPDASVSLATLESIASVTLVVEARVPAEGGSWELQNDQRTVLARGPIAPAPEAAGIRRLALHVAAGVLPGSGRYWLIARGRDVEEVGRWAFRVTG